jgi:hypothetical protein
MGQALAGGFLGDGLLVEAGALHEVVKRLVGRRLGGEQEVAACRPDGLGDRLAGEQVVAEDMGRRSFRRPPWAASQRLAALRSQSCFSAPSWGAMNSGIKGSAMAWPGATSVAASVEPRGSPGMAW